MLTNFFISTFLVFSSLNNNSILYNFEVNKEPSEEHNYSLKSSNSKYANIENNYNNFSFDPSIDSGCISCIDSEKVISKSSATFHFIATKKINKITALGNIKLKEFNIYESEISCTLSNFEKDEKIEIRFYHNDTLLDFFTLFFAKSNLNTIYSSSLSMDTAKRNAGQFLSYNLFDENYEHMSIKNKKPLLIADSLSNVSGTFKWTDDDNNVFPLVGAKVELTFSKTLQSYTTFTNDEGFYSLNYDKYQSSNLNIPYITVFADNGESVKVSYTGTYSKIAEINRNDTNGVFSYTFSPDKDGDIGKAMIIFQAAKNFSDFAKKNNDGITLPLCEIIYPGDPNYGCKYANNKIIITSKERSNNSYPHSYSSWDTIGHEYGHHVQRYYGISGSPGGKHGIGINGIDYQYNIKEEDNITRKYTLEQSKERGIKLARGEGWSSFWSIVAQSTFPEYLKVINTVGDTNYTSYNGLNYNLDSYINSYSLSALGDADEIAVQQILFKLYSAKIDEYDKFAIHFIDLLHIAIEIKPHSLYEFINGLYNAGYDRHDLGRLLAQYHVAIGNITIANNYLDECPTFSWSTDMGSNYLFYNSFDLVFLNPRGEEILRKNNLISNGKEGTYTLTKDEWALLIAVYGKVYYVYIVARQTFHFTSGNYFSELFEFYETDDFKNKIQIKPEERGFESQYYFEDNKEGSFHN